MKSKKYFLGIITILMALMLIPAYLIFAAGTAGISLSPLTGSHNVGQTFNVSIFINPGSDKIDTARVKLTFPADLLEIKSFSASSVFGYQAGSNGFDNSAGTFSWGAGTPGGITAPANFGTITFKAKKAGSASISVNKDSLALSAGVNNFNGQSNSSTYNLLAVVPAPKTVKKIQPVAVQQPVVAQPLADNNTVTQIIPKIQPKSFTASLLDSLSFLTLTRLLSFAAVILILALMIFTFRKLQKNNIKIQK